MSDAMKAREFGPSYRCECPQQSSEESKQFVHDGGSAEKDVIVANSAVKQDLNSPCSEHSPSLHQERPEIIHASFHGYLQVFLKATEGSGSLRGHTVGTNSLI